MAGNVAKANDHTRWIEKEAALREDLLQPYCEKESLLVFLHEVGFHNLARQLQNSFNKLDQIGDLYKEKNARKNAATHDYLYEGRPQSKRQVGVVRQQIKHRESEMQMIAGAIRDIVNDVFCAPLHFSNDAHKAIQQIEAYLHHLKVKYVRAKKGNISFERRRRHFKRQPKLNMVACF